MGLLEPNIARLVSDLSAGVISTPANETWLL